MGKNKVKSEILLRHCITKDNTHDTEEKLSEYRTALTNQCKEFISTVEAEVNWNIAFERTLTRYLCDSIKGEIEIFYDLAARRRLRYCEYPMLQTLYDNTNSSEEFKEPKKEFVTSIKKQKISLT